MDKKSDAKSAPTKRKISVGQTETKTTKSQTTKPKSGQTKASAKAGSESSAVKVTRKSNVKPLTAAANARPIKVADAKSPRTAQGTRATGSTTKAGTTAKADATAKVDATAKTGSTAKASSTTPTMTPKTVTLGASGGANRPSGSPASRSVHTQATSANRSARPQTAAATRSSAARPRKQNRKWWLIGGIILVVLVVIGIVALLFWLNRDPQKPVDGTTDTTSGQLEIDYNQKVTNPLGGNFSPTYQQGSNTDFSVRFVDLNCSDDQCSNVKNVKFAGKLLASDAYTVKRGSVIIVLKADTLKDLKVGQYTLSFEITEDGKTQLIGVKVKVTSSGETCPEGQTMQDGQCTDEKAEDDDEEKSETDQPDQQPENSKPDDNSSNDGQASGNNATGNDAGSTNTAQNECEKQAGPIKVLTGKWLSNDEKQAYAADTAFQAGDEIAVGGTTWSGGTSMKSSANGSCQPSVKGAEKSNDVTISDWLLPRSSSVFPETTRNHPYQNFVVWYYPNGTTQLEFVSGDPTQYILNHW